MTTEFKASLEKPGEPGTKEYLEGRVKHLEYHNSVLEKYRTDTDFDLEALTAKFSDIDLEWKPQRTAIYNKQPWAIVVPYLQARAVQDRLDKVAGPQNWQNTLQVTEKGMISTISIKINGEWISKQDVSDFSDIEAFKGAASGAFKRAAVLWGIGRYLYHFPKTYARFVDKNTKDAQYVKIDGEAFYWIPDIKS